MSIGEFIRMKRKQAGLSVDQLAEMIGKNRATVYRYENSFIEKLPIDILVPLAAALRVTPGELVNGDDKSSFDNQVIRNPREYGAFSYPVIEEGVAAGYFTDAEGVRELPMISVPDVLLGRYARNKDIVFMHVCGESMNNLMEDGTVIAVLRCDRERVSNGDVVIASMGGREYTVKYFYDFPESQQIILKPDSRDPAFVPIVISYENAEEFQIFGKVVIYQVEL